MRSNPYSWPQQNPLHNPVYPSSGRWQASEALPATRPRSPAVSKRAPAEHPIHDLVAERWSPVVFSEEPLTPQQIRTLFEGARWAASSYNEQPWVYIVGVKGTDGAWRRLLDCLMEANQAWAQHAPVLALAVASTRYARNDKPNKHAWYDVGQASASLALQAASMGLYVHQMGGFDPDKARERFAIPEDHEPIAAMAIGHLGDAGAADQGLAKRDAAPRARKGIDEFVFGADWGSFPDSLR